MKVGVWENFWWLAAVCLMHADISSWELLQSRNVYEFILANTDFEAKTNSSVTTECFSMEIDIKDLVFF